MTFMEKIMSLIEKYIDSIDYGEPIFSNDIHDYVINKIGKADKLVINEYIRRYSKDNPNFLRYKKGIYYRAKSTLFGPSVINQMKLIDRIYLSEGNVVQGYETGPSLINKIGLTTQVPRYSFYASNKNRVSYSNNSIKILKPVTKITNENYKYLQILDVIDNKYGVPFEVHNPQEIIRNLMDENDLDFEHLLYYAVFYKDDKIYKKIAELARRD